MKPDIYPIETIGTGSLSAMARPRSGEWIEEEFEGIRNEGIDLIVSLLESHEHKELGLEREEELANMNNMEFISFPIRDRSLPISFSEYWKFTKHLYSEAGSGKHVVVHCRAGIGRTGIVAAGVLIHHGVQPVKAFDLVSTCRRIEVPDTLEQKDWVISNYAKTASVT